VRAAVPPGAPVNNADFIPAIFSLLIFPQFTSVNQINHHPRPPGCPSVARSTHLEGWGKGLSVQNVRNYETLNSCFSNLADPRWPSVTRTWAARPHAAFLVQAGYAAKRQIRQEPCGDDLLQQLFFILLNISMSSRWIR
jgi:hypothetical protein